MEFLLTDTGGKKEKFIMKTRKNKKSERMGFTGYTDAPPEIEKEMEDAVLVKDFLPPPEKLVLNSISEKERKLTMKAWKRYRIKNHERGHRKPLAETLKEPTARLDTSIILPRRVYNWIGTKQNKAAFIREMMIKSYKKAVH
jgi:hypothetical protein